MSTTLDFANIISPPGWMHDAACAQIGGDEWFPEKGGSPRHAKWICARCPVISECLDYALAHEERFGIWGGTSERERRRLTQQRATHRPAPHPAPAPQATEAAAHERAVLLTEMAELGYARRTGAA